MVTTDARRRAVGAVLMALAVVLTACNSGGESPANDRPTVTTPSATTSQTPPTDEEQAGADAEAALLRFRDVFDQAWLDPTSSLEAFDTVADGRLLASVKANLDGARESGRTRTGRTTLDEVVVDHVRLPGGPADLVPTVTISACVDATDVKLFDGGELLPTSGEPRFAVIYEVTNDRYPDPGGWRVSSEESDGEGC